jgi:hypothetical protein
VTKDRRKQHVVEADEKLAQQLADKGDQEAGEPSEEPEREPELVLGDLGKGGQDYETLVQVHSMHPNPRSL